MLYINVSFLSVFSYRGFRCDSLWTKWTQPGGHRRQGVCIWRGAHPSSSCGKHHQLPWPRSQTLVKSLTGRDSTHTSYREQFHNHRQSTVHIWWSNGIPGGRISVERSARAGPENQHLASSENQWKSTHASIPPFHDLYREYIIRIWRL